MKRITLLKQIIIVGLMIGMVVPAIAQDLYLPATSKSKEAKAFYAKAITAFYDVEFPKAYDLASQALDADPNFFMGHFLNSFHTDKAIRQASIATMASYAGKLNKGEKVIKEMAMKINEDPKYKAVEDWRKIASMYKKNVFPKALLVTQLTGAEETLDEALGLLDECLKLDTELPFVYNSKGYIYLFQKEYGSAENAFDQYLKMAPKQANPYDSKGDYYMAIKNYPEAAYMYKKAYDMNETFTASLKKHKEAIWMAKRVEIAKEVAVKRDGLVEAYNAGDMRKYAKFYLNAPEFCFVVNGEVIDSYSEFVKRVYQSSEMFSKWHIKALKETIEVSAEHVATASTLYQFTGTQVGGEKMDFTGTFTSVWRKDDGKWRVIHAVNTNPLKD